MKTHAHTRTVRSSQAGFSMIEVLIAMLMGCVGLLGTVAVQTTMLNATANANDGAIAQRLASQAMEELTVRQVAPGVDQLAPVVTATWSTPAYLDANGRTFPGASATARWERRTWVRDQGVGQPYNVSVQVRYALDGGRPRVVQLDQERRK
jgi:type IV pilus modification protein PilV